MQFGILALIIVSISCSGINAGSDVSSQRLSKKQRAQLKSINDLLYKGSAKPQTPSKIELANARKILKSSAHGDELKIFKKLFNNNLMLVAYAMRDSDGDGIYDYRITTSMDGRFFEGDVDIDGDGVRNSDDADPYDKSIGMVDLNNNEIPDSVDFELKRPGSEIATIQQKLRQDYKVTLIERTARFPLKTAKVFYDALSMVFASQYKSNKNLRTLRTLASESHAWLYPDGDVTNAMVFGANQNMMIYKNSLKIPEVFQLLLFVHELAHSYQFNLDWDGRRAAAENSRSYHPLKKLTPILEQFNWKKRNKNISPKKEWHHMASLDENMPSFLYRNKTLDWWGKHIDTIYYDTLPGGEYLADSRIADKGIVGPYSLASTLEWHADQLAAAVAVQLVDAAEQHLSATQFQKIQGDFRKLEKIVWPDFRYDNIRGTKVFDHMKKEFPISGADLLVLSQKYLGWN